MNKKVNRKINTNNGKFPLPDVEVTDVHLIFNYDILNFSLCQFQNALRTKKGRRVSVMDKLQHHFYHSNLKVLNLVQSN